MNNNRDDFEATVLRLCSWCDYATVWRVFATRKKKKEGGKNYFLTTFHSGQVEDWLRSPDLRERNLLVIWRLTSIFVVNILGRCVRVTQSVWDVALCASLPPFVSCPTLRSLTSFSSPCHSLSLRRDASITDTRSNQLRTRSAGRTHGDSYSRIAITGVPLSSRFTDRHHSDGLAQPGIALTSLPLRCWRHVSETTPRFWETTLYFSADWGEDLDCWKISDGRKCRFII